MKERTATVLDKLAALVEQAELDGVGAVSVLRVAAMTLREGPGRVPLRDAFRRIVVRYTHAPSMVQNHLMTPCCSRPMVPIDGHNAGRPCVMFNPGNELVQCHRCGAVWSPLQSTINPTPTTQE